ncbi:carboxylesterase family protein-like protein, partial [Aureobasidium melanogenum]
MGPLSYITAVAALFFAAFSSICAQASGSSYPLPIVDLGYARQQASSYNSSGGYYNFSNIRYAAPPIGDLRFSAPQAPTVNRTHVQIGSVARICPQAIPEWEAIALQFLPAYLQGHTNFTMSDFDLSMISSNSSAIAVDPTEDEDCLLLDVMVPEDIFYSDEQHPVMVWIHGGGFLTGSKTVAGNPAGWLERSKNSDGSSGVIYVSINYRLGAMGWLSGPSFQENGTANAGLHDQRFALEWVQQNIHLFGGNPKNVTVIGESAGGGSILHQITAYGGNKGPVPFAGAVLQSPGFFPLASPSRQEQIFQDFLALLNVSTLDEARRLPSSAIIVASAKQVATNTPYGQTLYGPVVDGDFVPALPGQLLAHGQYDKDLSIMTGHNTDEGLIFTDPFISNGSALEAFLVTQFPALQSMPLTLAHITQNLYPPIFDGSQAQHYTNEIARAAAIISEVAFTCNTVYLQKAYEGSYAYLFDIAPSIHGQDVPYTFYNGNGSSDASSGDNLGVEDVAVAYLIQRYTAEFAKSSDPNSRGTPYFAKYGSNATTQALPIIPRTNRVDSFESPI